MNRIFIVGGDGFARECYYNLQNRINHGDKIAFGGFLGHAGYGHTVDYKNFQHHYRGELEEHIISDNDYFIIGAAYPAIRNIIYHDLKSLSVKHYTLIVHGVSLHETLNFGEANILLWPFASTVNIEIGIGNVFNGNTIIGHDSKIGDFNFFGPCVQVLGNVTIGDNNLIGANAIILPNVKIEDNNNISPLSAVYKGCKSNGYYHGNPAIRIGDIE